VSTGGAASTGGAKATGGMVSTGGTKATGGAMSTGGANAAGGSTAITFTTIYDTIINVRCVGCHAPGGGGLTTGKLDMSTPTLAYTDLVGVAAMGTGTGAMCSAIPGLVRVVPGSSATSLLWEKVNAKVNTTATVPCGSPMPLTGAALSQAQVDEIAAWINQGALNN